MPEAGFVDTHGRRCGDDGAGLPRWFGTAHVADLPWADGGHLRASERRLLVSMKQTVVKIVSGGQTGADRAALDFAIEHGIPHSG